MCALVQRYVVACFSLLFFKKGEKLPFNYLSIFKSAALDDIVSYQTLLASFSSSISAAKKTFFNDKINGATDARKLFSTFKTLLYPPPPPPATNLTADN